MRKWGLASILLSVLSVLSLPFSLLAQNIPLVLVSSDPTGSTSCNMRIQINVLTGGMWYPANPTPSTCTWQQMGKGVPSGGYIFIKTGTCPTGFTEDDALATYNILLTTAAAGDVGQTGGSNSYTPAGTSAAPTVASLTAAAQTFSGSSTTVPAETVNSLTAAAQTFSGATTTVPAETVNSLTAAAQTFSGTSSQSTSAVSAGTPAGSVANGVIAWPGGVPAIAAGTFTQPVIAAGTFTQPTIAWPTPVPTFSGSSGTVPAETFTGTSNQTTSSTSGGTPAGTISGAAFSITTVQLATAGSSGNYTGDKLGGTTLASGTSSITLSTQGTFAGSALAGHTHTLTPSGSNGTVSFTPAGTVAWPTGGSSVPTASGGAFTEGAISGGAYAEGAITWPAGVPTETAGAFSGSLLGTHAHTFTATGSNSSSSVTGTLNSTTLTPLGSNAASAVTGTLNSTTVTPLGSNAPSAVTGTLNAGAFTGTPATIIPPFFKMIACVAN